MKLIWSEESWDDYLYWQEADKRIVKKINELIKDTRRTPFEGKGKRNITCQVSGPDALQRSTFWYTRLLMIHCSLQHVVIIIEEIHS